MDSWSNQHFRREDKFRRPINSRRWAIESMPLHRVCRTHEQTRAGVGLPPGPHLLSDSANHIPTIEINRRRSKKRNHVPKRPDQTFSPTFLPLTITADCPTRNARSSLPTILPSLLNAKAKSGVWFNTYPVGRPKKGTTFGRASRACAAYVFGDDPSLNEMIRWTVFPPSSRTT